MQNHLEISSKSQFGGPKHAKLNQKAHGKCTESDRKFTESVRKLYGKCSKNVRNVYGKFTEFLHTLLYAFLQKKRF